MSTITFNDMPVALSGIIDQMNRIEAMLKLERPEPESDILNIDQAAELLGWAVSTIYQKINRLELPHYKQGSSLRFSRKDLNAWIVSGRKLTSQEQLTEYKSKTKSK